MTRFHSGFSEGGTLREKRKHIDSWIARLKATQYTPHPFDIVGATPNDANLSGLPKAPRQSTRPAG